MAADRSSNDLAALIATTAARVRPADEVWRRKAADRLDHLTKPPGSLGHLEEIAVRLAGIQGALELRTSPRRIIVCAADHGVVGEGVSAYPKAVTAQMVANFLRGGAAINALASTTGTPVWIVDVGVDGPVATPGAHARLITRRVRNGTRNMFVEPAMSASELRAAIQVGLDLAEQAVADEVRVLGLGEMGIGNTTAASAVTAALTGRDADAVTGRGTGVDDAQFARKVDVVTGTLARHRCRADAPLDVLRCMGGLELATLCGLCLGAAVGRIAIVTDGFVATAAALVAVALAPRVRDHLFAGHLSPEPGHAVQLEHLGLTPLLNLKMRLGEGTGAALAISLIEAAAHVFTSMATFESAGVSRES